VKYFKKIAAYKTWDDKLSFTEDLGGGAAIGSATAVLGSKYQTGIIKKKLKALQEIKKIKPNLVRMSIVGGLAGAALGYGKYLYEKEQYTK
jgi:hypothetical protein